ncbi:MAG: UDP-N-acetylmuramate dehydrogenase [Proteobacteria bacterium]|nr:UDP-N-acetylmuramate dehydrogenase [Pseudomonadota bacterium]
MMALKMTPERLIDRLPAVRGRYSENAPLHAINWFRVGGPAEIMFRPADAGDLAAFLAGKPGDVPVTVLGVGSNLLVRDGGIPGVVIRLGRAFAEISHKDARIHAGAAVLNLNVAMVARDAGIAGLEFLCGVPGTIGGGLRMNAGAYGREFKDVAVAAAALDARGDRHRLTNAELGFGYRQCAVPDDWIFLAAELAGEPGSSIDIQRRMAAIGAAREESQPLRTRTGGSTFANPADPHVGGRKAWELIDAAGCRGLVVGDAQVSEKHCNFLINRGRATATDLETLGEEVRRRVFEKFGVMLEWEIRRIGVPAKRDEGQTT